MSSLRYTLDSNALIALTVRNHEHHEPLQEWLCRSVIEKSGDQRATIISNPITQGSLARFLVRQGAPMAQVVQVLRCLQNESWHQFNPCDVSYTELSTRKTIGHKQVTDMYLIAQAQADRSVLLTLDKALLHLYPGVTASPLWGSEKLVE